MQKIRKSNLILGISISLITFLLMLGTHQAADAGIYSTINRNSSEIPLQSFTADPPTHPNNPKESSSRFIGHTEFPVPRDELFGSHSSLENERLTSAESRELNEEPGQNAAPRPKRKMSDMFFGFIYAFNAGNLFIYFLIALLVPVHASMIALIAPVYLFGSALVIYILRKRANRLPRAWAIRAMAFTVIGLLVIYILGASIFNAGQDIASSRTIQLLTMFGTVLVLFFVTSAMPFLFKEQRELKKRFIAVFRRTTIYSVSILLLLLPLIMILCGNQADAMLLIKSHIMIFSGILFFFGALLEEDWNHSGEDARQNVRRKRRQMLFHIFAALFAISLIACLYCTYHYSLLTGGFEGYDKTIETSSIYSAFNVLFSSLYDNSIILNKRS